MLNEVNRMFGLAFPDKPLPAHGAGFTTGCCDCGAPLRHDRFRCDRHAAEIAEERRDEGRWDDRYSEWEDAA